MNRQIRSSQVSSTRTGIARLAIVLCAALFASQLAALSPAAAAVTPTVNLGAAASFSVLGATGVTNTGITVVGGDVGLSPSGAITGFFPFGPGVVLGETHDKDLVAASAQTARFDAYNDAAGRTPTAPDFAGDQIGNTFAPGVHHSAGAFANTGAMTLDAGGDPNAVFIFQIGAAFSPAAGSSIVLAGDARADNVFWQVLGAVSIGAAPSSYVGTFLTEGAFTLGAGGSLDGRALSAGSVILTNNVITEPLPVDTTAPTVTIVGGATALTNDSTPTISGTASEPVGTPVTVTGIGSAMTTTVTGAGTWTVTQTTPVAEDTYTVVASVTDPAGNTGTATQSLTVDTTAPTVAITGGATALTNDSTPTIGGTTTGADGRTLTVSGIGPDLTVTVAGDGSWSVTPATAVADDTYTVLASVTDVAGNAGNDTQALTVDTVVPVVAIDGGSPAFTADTTPTITGTTDAVSGSTVTVSGIGSTMTTTVTVANTWTVTQTTPVAEDTYTVLASITNQYGTGTATQTLTVDTTAPTVAITGGATALTNDSTPTIGGTTTGADGRTLTVSGIGPDLTVTVAGDGSWSVTPATAVADDTYTVLASVTDVAGNAGDDTQDLTVDTDAVEPAPRYRPDASIRLPSGRWVGTRVYGHFSAQQVVKEIRRQGTSATFLIRVTNRGNTADRLKVKGRSLTNRFKLSFRAGGKNVTSAVTAGTYRTRSLAPGGSVLLVVKVIRTEVHWFGNKKTFRIRTTSSHAWRKRDAVAAVVASFPRR